MKRLISGVIALVLLLVGVAFAADRTVTTLSGGDAAAAKKAYSVRQGAEDAVKHFQDRLTKAQAALVRAKEAEQAEAQKLADRLSVAGAKHRIRVTTKRDNSADTDVVELVSGD